MTDDATMSPGEIGRHLGRIEATITAGFAEIKADLDKYVLQSVHDAEMRGIGQRIGDIEKDLEQAQSRQRASLALIVTSLLGVLSLAIAGANLIL